MYVSPGRAAEHYNVTTNTIRLWADAGKIQVIKTDGGHRRYFIENQQDKKKERQKIIYCRVSGVKQKRDLERQCQYLRERYPNHELVTDIGSGINFKRTGFLRIMEGVFNQDIGEVVVAHRDRWARIGFELFEWIFQEFESKIICLDKEVENTERELAKDLMEIITVFSARFYGKRSYKNSEDKIVADKGPTTSIKNVDGHV